MHDPGARLARWAAEQPEAVAFNFLERGENLTASLSFGTLHQRAAALARLLLRDGLSGRPVLLLYPPGLDFIEAFCACLYSGAIAVPAPYPVNARAAARSAGLCQAAGVDAILTVESLIKDRNLRQALDEAAPGAGWIATDKVAASDGADEACVGLSPDAPAFLQFTSGSTGNPKGVIVTRGNLAANQAMIASAFGHDRTTRFVTWLPMFHDMGLIGTVLQPLYLGVSSTIMSPFAFLQKPVRWLRAIDRWQGTTSGAPNFAYDLCLHLIRPDQCEGLDLSAWRVAFCGAEPVRSATLRRFAEMFAGHEFREQAFLPCYGLAEATLFVTGGPAGTGVRSLDGERAPAMPMKIASPGAAGTGSVTVTSCGRPWGDQRLAIVDPDTGVPLRPGEVGEIWVAGPHVCAGYWRHPDGTAATFNAHCVGDDSTLYLRTGDLGFLWDGELFVTGRLKDLIIVRGAKHHPEEIEATIAANVPQPAGGAGAVFTIDDKAGEKIVVLFEAGRETPDADGQAALKQSIEAAVNIHHGFRPDELLLLRTGSLPRTTSGKVQRHLCRDAYRDGRFAALAEAKP